MTSQDVMPGMIWHHPGRDGGEIVTVQPVLDVEQTAAELWPPDGRRR